MFFHKLLAKRLNHNVATVYFVSVPQMSVGKMVFDQKTWEQIGRSSHLASGSGLLNCGSSFESQTMS
jgi:hypothetical protein